MQICVIFCKNFKLNFKKLLSIGASSAYVALIMLALYRYFAISSLVMIKNTININPVNITNEHYVVLDQEILARYQNQITDQNLNIEPVIENSSNDLEIIAETSNVRNKINSEQEELMPIDSSEILQADVSDQSVDELEGSVDNVDEVDVANTATEESELIKSNNAISELANEKNSLEEITPEIVAKNSEKDKIDSKQNHEVSDIVIYSYASDQKNLKNNDNKNKISTIKATENDSSISKNENKSFVTKVIDDSIEEMNKKIFGKSNKLNKKTKSNEDRIAYNENGADNIKKTLTVNSKSNLVNDLKIFSNLNTAPKAATSLTQKKFNNSVFSIDTKHLNTGPAKTLITAIDTTSDTLDGLKDFSVRNLIDNEIIFSAGKNKVLLEEEVHDSATKVIAIESPGFMNVRTEVKIKNNLNSEIEIPMMSQLAMSDLYKKYNISGAFGHLLVALNDTVDDADINQDGLKIYVDQNLNEVAKKDSFYVMFLALTPGVAEFSMHSQQGPIVKSLIFISEDTISYSNEELVRQSENNYYFYTNKPFSIQKSQAFILSNSVRDELSNEPLEKIGVNVFKNFDRMKVADQNEFLNIKYEDVFYTASVSSETENQEVTLPNKLFIQNILDEYNVGNIDESCLVEMNVDKIESIDYYTETAIADENTNDWHIVEGEIEPLFLDKSGEFTQQINLSTKKIILLGESNSQIHIRINHANGSTSELNTMCGHQTYTVFNL